jgi:hypothetical protein
MEKFNLVLLFIPTWLANKNRLPTTMARLLTRSAEVDRAAHSAFIAADKMQLPPKHEKNVLIQSLVKHIEEEKIHKGEITALSLPL